MMKISNMTEDEFQLVEYYRMGYRPIWWSFDDFEMQAQELEENFPEKKYDRSLFLDTLELMLRRHDPNFGTTWQDVQYFLDEYCLIRNDEAKSVIDNLTKEVAND